MVGDSRWPGSRFHARGDLPSNGMGEHDPQCRKFRLVQATATTSGMASIASYGMGTIFPTAFGPPIGLSWADPRRSSLLCILLPFGMGVGDFASPVLKELTAYVREVRSLSTGRLGIIDRSLRPVCAPYRYRSNVGLAFLRALLVGILSDSPTGSGIDDGPSIPLPTSNTPRRLGGGARLSMDSVIR